MAEFNCFSLSTLEKKNVFFLFFIKVRFPKATYRDAVSRLWCVYKHGVYFTHQDSKSSWCPARFGFGEVSLSLALCSQTVVETESQGFQNSWEAWTKALAPLQWDTPAELGGFNVWRLLIKWKQVVSSWNAAVAVGFLAAVRVLLALCSWTFLKCHGCHYASVCVDMKTTPLAQLSLCAIMFKTNTAFMSCEDRNKWGRDFQGEKGGFTVTSLACRSLFFNCFACAIC